MLPSLKNGPDGLLLGVKCFHVTCTTWSVRFFTWSTVTDGVCLYGLFVVGFQA